MRITSSGSNGRETVQLIGYEDAVNRLDAGGYDDSSAGYDIPCRSRGRKLRIFRLYRAAQRHYVALADCCNVRF